MKLFAYHVGVPDLNLYDELRLLTQWRHVWSTMGFEPFVLNEWHARQHPFYARYNAVVSQLPTGNPKIYELACWLRWLALSQVGGGVMLDYDVFPNPDVDSDTLWKVLSLSTASEIAAEIKVLQAPCCPSVVFASKENALRFCENVASGKLGSRPQNGRAHFSDQYALDDLVTAGEEWVRVHDVVKIYSDANWEKAPLLHFANAMMMPKSWIPRWRHIPRLLSA